MRREGLHLGLLRALFSREGWRDWGQVGTIGCAIRSFAAENDGLLVRSRASAVLVVSGYEGAWMGVG